MFPLSVCSATVSAPKVLAWRAALLIVPASNVNWIPLAANIASKILDRAGYFDASLTGDVIFTTLPLSSASNVTRFSEDLTVTVARGDMERNQLTRVNGSSTFAVSPPTAFTHVAARKLSVAQEDVSSDVTFTRTAA